MESGIAVLEVIIKKGSISIRSLAFPLRVFRIEITNNDRFGIQICEDLKFLDIKGTLKVIVDVYNGDSVYFYG